MTTTAMDRPRRETVSRSTAMAAPSSTSASSRSSRSCSFFGLPADADAEDIDYLLGDVAHALSRVDAKRGVLQERIATASRGRGKRRASRRRPPAAPAADDAGVALPLLPPPVDDHYDGHGAVYTRKGAAGVVRRRLRDATGDAKKERKRLEAVCGDLEEALVDAKELLALQGGGTA